MQRAYLATADAAGLFEIALHLAKRALGARQEVFACGGKADRTRGAGKQGIPQDLLETADLLGKRWLRKMKPLSGSAEVKFFGDGHEVAKMAKLDVLIHMSIILIARNKILDVWLRQEETHA
jgi:hypothetical protein